MFRKLEYERWRMKKIFLLFLSLFFVSQLSAIQFNKLSLFYSSANGWVNNAITLNSATGNEVAIQINYTTNKATSGNDTGLIVNQTDTASPGTSNLLDLQVGGVSKVAIANTGQIGASCFVASTTEGFSANTTGTDYGGSNHNVEIYLQNFPNFTTDNKTAIKAIGGTISNTGGTFKAFAITPTYNQTSGTSANTDLLVNRTQTAIGSGTQRLFDVQVGGTTNFNVTNLGAVGLKTGFNINTSTPTAVGQLVVNSSYVLYISTGTGLAQYQKVGAQ